jgi:hypothetical protein
LRGVHVLDRSSGAEIMFSAADPLDYIVGLAFGRDGGLNLASLFGVLKRYGPDLRLRAHRDLQRWPSASVVDLAIDPSGQRVAVAYSGLSFGRNMHNNIVSILDAQTLKPIAEAKTGDPEQVALRSIAWSGDGATVVAVLTTKPVIAPNHQVLEDEHVLIRRVNVNGQLYGEDINVGDVNSVFGFPIPPAGGGAFEFQRCGDGFVFTTGKDDKPFVFVSALGVVQFVPSPPDEAVSTGDAAK